jgi:hypothetical protein
MWNSALSRITRLGFPSVSTRFSSRSDSACGTGWRYCTTYNTPARSRGTSPWRSWLLRNTTDAPSVRWHGKAPQHPSVL